MKGSPQVARLMSVDPSLTCSGWALFSVGRQRLVAVGKLRSLPPHTPLAERLRDLQARFATCLDEMQLRRGDFLVCEAPTTMRDPRAALLVEQVRALFEALARERQLVVPGRVNPRTVHHEVMGLRGKQLPRKEIKAAATRIVATLYRKELAELGFSSDEAALRRHQDVVDAILVGNVALARIQTAQASGVPAEVIFESLVKKTVRHRAVRQKVTL